MTDKELARQRYANSVRLLTTWEDIVRRYKDTPADEDDEIDLRTGKLVRDRGKLKKMKGTRRFGFFSGFLVGEEGEEGEEGGEYQEGEEDDVEEDQQMERRQTEPGTSKSTKQTRRSRSASASRGGGRRSTSRPPSRPPSLTPSEGFFAARQRPQIDPADLKAFLAENAVLMADFVDEEDDFSGIEEVTVYGGDTDRESVYGRTDVESGNDLDDSDEDDSSDGEQISGTSFRPSTSFQEVGIEPEKVVRGVEFEPSPRIVDSLPVVDPSEISQSSASEEEGRIDSSGPRRKGKEREVQQPARRTSRLSKRRRIISDDDEDEEQVQQELAKSIFPQPHPSPSPPPKKTTNRRVSRSGLPPPLEPAAPPPAIANADFDPILPDRPTVAGFPTIQWHRNELPKILDLPIIKLKDIYAPNVRYGSSSWTSISPHILFNLPRDYDPVNPTAERPTALFNEEIELPGGGIVYAPSRQVVKSREEVAEAATRDAHKRKRMKNVERDRKLAERREQEKRERDSEPKPAAAPLRRTSGGRWAKTEEGKDDVAFPSVAEVGRRKDATLPAAVASTSSRIPISSSHSGLSPHAGPSNSDRQPLQPPNSLTTSSLPPPSRTNLAATSSWAAEVSSHLPSKLSPPPPASFVAPPPPKPRLSTRLKPLTKSNKPLCHNCLSFGRDLVASVCPGRQANRNCTGGDPKVVQLAYPGRCLRCLFQGREEESKTCLGGKWGNLRCENGGGKERSKRTRVMREREERRQRRRIEKEAKGRGGSAKLKENAKEKGKKRRKLVSEDEEEEEFGDEHETAEEDASSDNEIFSAGKVAVASGSKRKMRSSGRLAGEVEEGGEGRDASTRTEKSRFLT